MNKPRRIGTIKEYQHGHWFLYLTEWEETTGQGGRKHTEVEIYYAKAEHVWSSSDKDNILGNPVWNTTDPNKLNQAMKIFFDLPESFKNTREGELPINDSRG